MLDSLFTIDDAITIDDCPGIIAMIVAAGTVNPSLRVVLDNGDVQWIRASQISVDS